MSVSDNQDASAAIFNAAYVSKTVESTVAAPINLNAPSSGDPVTGLQKVINDLLDSVSPSVVGTRGSPTAITTSIPFSSSQTLNTIFATGSGGAVDITATNPQIVAGTILGQRLLIIGCSDTNTIKMTDGNGIKTSGGGDLFLFADTAAEFFWNGSAWTQIL